MLDYYSVSGCYILKPWSYSIWEQIQGTSQILQSLFLIHLLLRMVQRANQGDGCPKFVLSHVYLCKGLRTGKGPY
jgi:hypothetical protein